MSSHSAPIARSQQSDLCLFLFSLTLISLAGMAGHIALLKVESGRVLEQVNRQAQQVMGGLGYQRGGSHAGARIEQISRDLRVMVVGGGSDEILTDLGVRMEKMKADSKL